MAWSCNIEDSDPKERSTTKARQRAMQFLGQGSGLRSLQFLQLEQPKGSERLPLSGWSASCARSATVPDSFLWPSIAIRNWFLSMSTRHVIPEYPTRRYQSRHPLLQYMQSTAARCLTRLPCHWCRAVFEGASAVEMLVPLATTSAFLGRAGLVLCSVLYVALLARCLRRATSWNIVSTQPQLPHHCQALRK